jgi:hypothetical protein
MTGILDEVLAHLRGDSETWKELSVAYLTNSSEQQWIRDLGKKEYDSDLEMIKKIEQFKESLEAV